MKIEKKRESRGDIEMETKKQSCSSHNWWFDSYNGTKCSPWLESTIAELNEKASSMLKIIEEDADSFAQRAEMYYKKRPELISMVEDFYRAHRSLAERYDLLKNDRVVRVKSPSRSSLSLSKEGYEYVDDSVNSVKSFDSFTEAAYSSEEAAESEIDDPEHEDDGVDVDQETEKPFAGGVSYDELMKLREELDRLREENEAQKNIIKQKDEEKEELVKLLSDNNSELRDREEMTDEVLVPFEEVTELKEELESLKEQLNKKSFEVVEVTKKFEEAKFDLGKLEQEAQKENKYLMDAIVRKEEENVQIARHFEEMGNELLRFGEQRGRENELRRVEDMQVVIRQLNEALRVKDVEKREAMRQLNDALTEKNTEKREAIRQLTEVLAEKDEQKREAIRQLSLAMEMLREESKLLKKTLVSFSPKKKTADRQVFKGVNLSKLFNLSPSSKSSVVVPL